MKIPDAVKTKVDAAIRLDRQVQAAHLYDKSRRWLTGTNGQKMFVERPIPPVEELGELGRQRHLHGNQHQQLRLQPTGRYLRNELDLLRGRGGGPLGRWLARIRAQQPVRPEVASIRRPAHCGRSRGLLTQLAAVHGHPRSARC